MERDDIFSAVALRYPEWADAPYISAKAKGSVAERLVRIMFPLWKTLRWRMCSPCRIWVLLFLKKLMPRLPQFLLLYLN